MEDESKTTGTLTLNSNKHKEPEYYDGRKLSVYGLKDKMDQITPGLADNFRHVQDEQFMLFLQKNLDYGSKNITAGLNLDNPEEIKFVLNGLWYRISDKVNRWRNIQMKGEMEVTNESLLDIFQDIANYACISSLVARGLWKS